MTKIHRKLSEEIVTSKALFNPYKYKIIKLHDYRLGSGSTILT